MYTSFKGRSIQFDKKVQVYRNLNNGSLSIKQNGLVVGHADIIALSEVKFIVNQKGRERVLREGRKNVHAFVEGYFVPSSIDIQMEDSVCYNPYNMDSFIFAFSNRTVSEADYFKAYSNGKMFVQGGR